MNGKTVGGILVIASFIIVFIGILIEILIPVRKLGFVEPFFKIGAYSFIAGVPIYFIGKREQKKKSDSKSDN